MTTRAGKKRKELHPTKGDEEGSEGSDGSADWSVWIKVTSVSSHAEFGVCQASQKGSPAEKQAHTFVEQLIGIT